MLFETYLFADYSGARDRGAQRKAIRLATAVGLKPPVVVQRSFTRDELVDEFVSQLRAATRLGRRVCFGQDHQYGVPFALGRELGLGLRSWRYVLEALCTGSYGQGAPALGDASVFAPAFNRWLQSQGRAPYFFSATKAQLYGIPSTNPRQNDQSMYRLTELCRPSTHAGLPKPFNRVGDNGTVGGQTLVGLIAIRDLLARCAKDNIPIKVWPFDGLSIADPSYANAHVLLEPYPTAVREAHVAQTDSDDAIASVAHVQLADRKGTLAPLLDLSGIESVQALVVQFEGWIVSHVFR